MDSTLTKYENYISLGYFCNIAMDLEALGLRNTSSPFDWQISNFEGVIKAINNRFAGFMDKDKLIQSEKYRNHYYDPNYKIFFFHDFNKYIPLSLQYEEVREKYNRRINRFLDNITNPTLFFRYIFNEKNSLEELKYIENNYQQILDILHSFNPDNQIIFIANEELKSDKIKIYHVKKDEGDVVSRHPIINNPELFKIVSKCTISKQKDNIKRYEEKMRYRNSFKYKLYNKSKSLINRSFRKVYIHDKSYYWEDK